MDRARTPRGSSKVSATASGRCLHSAARPGALQRRAALDTPRRVHRAVVRLQSRRRAEAHVDSWWRFDSWSLRSTADTWLSTVLIEISSSVAISL